MVAVDIGTTTIVGTLIDLCTGDEIGIYSTLNPQKMYGDDVISRISHTIENKDGLKKLQQTVLESLNTMFDFFEQKYNISAENIYHVNFVGNTVMIHLLAGLPVENIASVPFQPVVTSLPNIQSRDLGLNINPNAVITSLPMIASYIGADTVACILATDMLEESGYSLLVDIGTNGEIAWKQGGTAGMCHCSRTGLKNTYTVRHRWVRGAVNKIELNENGVSYTTIGPAGNRYLRFGDCGRGSPYDQ